MIYLLKASANSKRFGELIERDSSYSEVYFSLDKAVLLLLTFFFKLFLLLFISLIISKLIDVLLIIEN